MKNSEIAIQSFRRKEIGIVLEMAAAEQWLADVWEFEFLLAQFPQGCFSATDSSGVLRGVVTSIPHGRSGWIGNLIVSEGYRGRGIGQMLFKTAKAALDTAGVETVWLTASEGGKPIYEKQGFKAVDSIVRWQGTGRHNNPVGEAVFESVVTRETQEIDSVAWGDQRVSLLQATVNRGRLFRNSWGFLCIQPCGQARHCGPFCALDGAVADSLLASGLEYVSVDERIYADCPASNRDGEKIFRRHGFDAVGANHLMLWGRMPDFRPVLVYGLATLGSCG